LFEALSNNWVTSQEVAGVQQAVYLAEYLRHLKAKTILVEHGYVDRDYLEDYASYYVGNFLPYPKLTKRLHFFAQALSKQDASRALGRNDPRTIAIIKDRYLGFVVARPLPGSVVGRTALVTYERQSPDGIRYYPVRRLYKPHLFGIELPIQSLAYQQQDRTVAACATVALWTAFHKTEELFSSGKLTPAAITRVANSVRGSHRAMPARNLTPEQMAEAIRHVGLEPELVEIQADTPLSSLIYSYASYGVPVVLLVHIEGQGGHAMTVTGYKIGPKPPTAAEPLNEHLQYRGRFINEFFVHDDNVGPFAHLRPVDIPKRLRSDENFANKPYGFEIEFPGRGDERPRLLCSPLMAIIPVYPKIRLNFIGLHGWLNGYSVVLKEYASKLGIDPKELIWDVRLDSSNAFKGELREKREIDSSSVVLRPYPKYIWRAEITLARRKIVELTVDTTEMAHACPFLDAIPYDALFNNELRRFFSLRQVRVAWAPKITPRFVQFLATGSLK
jgi:hypothetical protein